MSLAGAVHRVEQALDACAAEPLDGLDGTELADAIVGLRRVAARLEVEIARVVHAADAATVWGSAGATSMDAWLAGATQASLRTARDQVRLADTFAAAPAVADAVAAGRVSLDNARLIATVVDHPSFADHADEVIGLAEEGSPRQTKVGIEHWLAAVDTDAESTREERARARRCISFTPTSDGMVAVAGLLTGADAVVVQNALDHLAGAAYDDETGRTRTMRAADALVELCQAYSAGAVTGGRERPQLLVTVSYETLVERAAGRGAVVGTDVTLSSEAVRRLACDAGLHRVITKAPGVVLDFGTTTRLASESQFMAMAARDGGCRWPGCERPPGWSEAHHIDEAFRDDGPTSTLNMILLCSQHHTLVHAPGWVLTGDAEDLHVHHPDGRVTQAPACGPLAQPATQHRQLALSA